MNVFHLHLIWFFIFLLITVLSFLTLLVISYFNTSYYLDFRLFTIWNIDIKVSFYLDWISVSFIRVVLLISTIIIVYSYNYIAPYSKSSIFLWLTVLFVTSMLLVITMSNLFFTILGWDGLGLISFFLIVYYQNQSSITSGLFTLLINRIGDSFFLVRILFIFYFYSDLRNFSSNLTYWFTTFILIITFITKRALYPFSPWLPLAIAAPTPISALVHSSTLVTSGLYLIIRYSYLFYSNPFFIKILLIISIFTSFYAGLNTIFETDLKKLIALSTLSHLGFIGMSFSVGLLYLRFFHLLVHALFKSLLFMTIGDIIINLNHSQDIRYLSKGYLYTPFSCLIINISIINLLGIPNLSGYFSKDLVLESMNYNNSSIFVSFILYVNVLFTYYYSYKLFFYRFQSIKLNPYQLFHSPSLLHAILLFFLSLSTFSFSIFYINYLFNFIIFYSIVFSIKFFPLFLNFSIFIYLFIFLCLPTYKNKSASLYFSSILYLSNIMISLTSRIYYNVFFNTVKSVEIGFINFTLNRKFPSFFFPLSTFIFKSLLKINFYTIRFFLFILVFLFLSI